MLLLDAIAGVRRWNVVCCEDGRLIFEETLMDRKRLTTAAARYDSWGVVWWCEAAGI